MNSADPMALRVVLRNHTPHEVIVILDSGHEVVLPPLAPTPRLDVVRVRDGTIDLGGARVPLTRIRQVGGISGLPPAEPGTMFVVSRQVAEECPTRDDLVFPDDLVRDERQRVVGCRALGRPAPRSGSRY